MKALQFSVNVPKFILVKTLKSVLGERVFYKGPVKTVRLVDIPEPSLPSSGWVKIRTRFCGFCGSDLNLIRLHDSPTASPFTSFPCIMGHEMVGEIVETGASVTDFKTGDRVAINPILACRVRGISPLCPSCRSGRPGNCENSARGDLPPGMFLGINKGVNGGFAPCLVAHHSQLYRIPKKLNLKAAALTEPVAVALQTLFDNFPKADEKVLVIGAGVIGNLIVQAARALEPDCHISVMEPSAFAADLARQVGADEIVASKNVFPETARITRATVYKPMLGMNIAMGGFDRIYDTVGAASTLNLAMRLLTAMGTLSVVGIGGNVSLDLTPLWLKLQTIRGVYAYGTVIYQGQSRPVFEIALELMEQGKINADILVTHTFGLADYRQMIEVNMNKARHQIMKTVVAFEPSSVKKINEEPK